MRGMLTMKLDVLAIALLATFCNGSDTAGRKEPSFGVGFGFGLDYAFVWISPR